MFLDNNSANLTLKTALENLSNNNNNTYKAGVLSPSNLLDDQEEHYLKQERRRRLFKGSEHQELCMASFKKDDSVLDGVDVPGSAAAISEMTPNSTNLLNLQFPKILLIENQNNDNQNDEDSFQTSEQEEPSIHVKEETEGKPTDGHQEKQILNLILGHNSLHPDQQEGYIGDNLNDEYRGSLLWRCKDKILSSPVMKIVKWFELEDIVISPDSTFKLLWDFFLMVMVLVNIFYIPLKIAFTLDTQNNESYQIFFTGYGAKIVFLLDILLNFNTAFFKQGVLIKDRMEIIYRYGSQIAWLDIILVGIFYFNSNLPSKYIEAIFVLRVYAIRSIVQRMEEVFHPRNLGAAMIDIMKVVFVVSFIAHLACCSFYLLSTLENSTTVTWVTKLELPLDSWFGLYIAGLYFSVITMITLGYGDIVPITTKERIFVIGMTLVSCAVFAYSVNTISGIIGDMSQRKKQFRLKMMNLNLHIQKRGLNKQLAMRVRKYIEYLYKEELISNESAEKDLEQIPLSLKEDVYCDIYGKILRQNKVFNLNFSPQFLDRLALKMKEKRYGPEEVIFKKGEEGSTLYFLTKGEVQLFFPIKNPSDSEFLKLSTLLKGDTFGFLSFFSGNKRESSARSMRVTSVVTLQYTDFLEVAQKFPLDTERFFMLRDQVNFNGVTKGLDVKCKSCQNFTHTLEECPFIKYQPQKTILIAKHNQPTDQERMPAERSKQKNANTLFFFQFLNNDKDAICDYFGFERIPTEDQITDQDDYDEENEDYVCALSHQIAVEKRPSALSNNLLIDANNNPDGQAYQDIQINRRQGSMQRMESTISYKKRLMQAQFMKSASRVPSMATAIHQQADSKREPIIAPKKKDFMIIEMDKYKIFMRYMTHNNLDAVLKQMQESIIYQKAYKQKINSKYEINHKQRDKINLSEIRDKAGIKKGISPRRQLLMKQQQQSSQIGTPSMDGSFQLKPPELIDMNSEINNAESVEGSPSAPIVKNPLSPERVVEQQQYWSKATLKGTNAQKIRKNSRQQSSIEVSPILNNNIDKRELRRFSGKKLSFAIKSPQFNGDEEESPKIPNGTGISGDGRNKWRKSSHNNNNNLTQKAITPQIYLDHSPSQFSASNINGSSQQRRPSRNIRHAASQDHSTLEVNSNYQQ